jgi:hypothetical protein
MLRIYQIFGILLLAAFAWAGFRGWAPGTEEQQEALAAESRESDASGSRTRFSPSRGSLRNRTYRGGK